jgi:hypothetical protein
MSHLKGFSAPWTDWLWRSKPRFDAINVCYAEKVTKHISNTLMRLVTFSAKQTLHSKGIFLLFHSFMNCKIFFRCETRIANFTAELCISMAICNMGIGPRLQALNRKMCPNWNISQLDSNFLTTKCFQFVHILFYKARHSNYVVSVTFSIY